MTHFSVSVKNDLTENIKSLGQRIDFVRGEASQRAFAERLGMSLSQLQGYLKNKTKPAYDVVSQIAAITGCDPGWLLTGHGTPFPPARPDTDAARAELAELLNRARVVRDELDAMIRALEKYANE